MKRRKSDRAKIGGEGGDAAKKKIGAALYSLRSFFSPKTREVAARDSGDK